MKPNIQYLLVPALVTLAACGGEESETTQTQPAGADTPTGAPASAPAEDAAEQAPGAQKNASVQPNKRPKATARPQGRGASKAIGAPSQDPTSEMRSLVPADAFLWVELDSLDRLEDLMVEVGELIPGIPIPPVEMMLGNLKDFGIDPSEVRTDAPLGLALSMGHGMEPAPTIVINVRNAASLAAKLQGAPGMPTPSTSGNAVAIPMHESYKADAKHGEMLATQLPEGALSCRLHMAYLIDSFGDTIKQKTDMAKAMASSQSPNSEFNAIYENQVDQGMDILEDTRFLSFGLDLEDGQLGLAFAMELLESSTYANLGGGEGRDISDLAQYVGEQDAMVILGSLHRRHFDTLLRPLVDGMALNTGYEEGTQLRQAYSSFEALLGDQGSSFAVVAHMDQRATDVSAVLQGVDSKAAADQVSELFDGFATFGDSLVASEPVKGIESGSHFLQYDYVPSPTAVTTAKGREAMANLESTFGMPRLRVRAITQGDEAMLTVGEGGSLAAKASQADRQPGGELAWGLGHIAGRSPSLLYRFDLNRASHGMARIAAGNGYMTPSPSAFDVKLGLAEVPSMWITSWMVLDSTVWEGGLRFDLGAAVAMGQQAASGGFGPMPR